MSNRTPLTWLLSLISLTLWSVLSNAQPLHPMSFSTFWPCAGNIYLCAPRILAEGNIEIDSSEKLAAFLNNANSSGHDLPPKPMVCFNSPGGDIRGAMRLGQVIRDLGLNTCVEPYYDRVIPGTLGDQEMFVDGVVCASACLFALIGGVNRFIERASRIGVHQFYSPNGSIGDEATQKVVVVLAKYLEQMGVSRSLLDIASLVPPQDIQWLTRNQLQQFRVDNMVVVTSPWTLDALEDGSIFAHIVQVKPGTQGRVSLSVRKVYDQTLLDMAFTPWHIGPDDFETALNVLSYGSFEVRIDRHRVGFFESVRWQIFKSTIITTVPLSPLATERLRFGSTLEVRVHVPNAFSEYDPSVEVSLNGADAIFAAALK